MHVRPDLLDALEHAAAAGRRPWTDRVVVEPFKRFGNNAASGGLVLLLAAAAAMFWANSPWHGVYHAIFSADIVLAVGGWVVREPFHGWIDDVVMALFFLLVGMEIKREVFFGELSDARTATLPIVAAAGGMLAPALIYLGVNAAGDAAGWAGVNYHGWGVPVATDIAFALGVLSLLGRRVPSSLRLFLCTLAIADDVGALIVIAFFYTSDLDLTLLAWSMVPLGVVFAMSRLGVREPIVYMLAGLAMVFLMLGSGVHATIAGVLLATQVPVSARVDDRSFVRASREALDAFEASSLPQDPESEPARPGEQAFHRLSPGQIAAARVLTINARHIRPTLQRIEWALSSWVSFLVLPLFALGNAGVRVVGGHEGHGATADAGAWLFTPTTVGVFLGLLVGKPIGIVAACWATVRTGLGALPEGVRWSHLAGVGLLGGVGFTMAIFITNLAFTGEDAAARDGARIAILSASACASVGGLAWLAAAARRA